MLSYEKAGARCIGIASNSASTDAQPLVPIRAGVSKRALRARNVSRSLFPRGAWTTLRIPRYLAITIESRGAFKCARPAEWRFTPGFAHRAGSRGQIYL